MVVNEDCLGVLEMLLNVCLWICEDLSLSKALDLFHLIVSVIATPWLQGNILGKLQRLVMSGKSASFCFLFFLL